MGMTYDAIAVKLKAILDPVTDIGIVYKTPQFFDDVTKIESKFLKDNRLNTQFIYRPDIPESEAQTGNQMKDFQHWEITSYVSVNDGGESFEFIQRQLDNMRDALDSQANAVLGSAVCVVPPSTVSPIDEDDFMGLLCHIITVNLQINNVRVL